MPSNRRQYLLAALFLLLLIFVVWSYNWWICLAGGLVLGALYYPGTYNFIKRWWSGLSGTSKLLAEWLLAILLGTLVVTGLNSYLWGVYKVRSSSMQTGFTTGELLIIDKFQAGPPINVNDPNRFKRLKGNGKIDRADVIVFHFPEGDTIVNDLQQESFYFLKRQYQNRKNLEEDDFRANLTYKPLKKRAKFIKRVIGLPGDTVSFHQSRGTVNGKPVTKLPTVIQKYMLLAGITSGQRQAILNYARDQYSKDNHIFVELSNEVISSNKLEALIVQEVLPLNLPDPNIFPFSKLYFWNKDNFGPIIVPAKGQTVQLTELNLPLYRRIIESYEKNEFRISDGHIFINGEPAQHYTFKMDYYWVLGDNRPHSYDSRYWGFVPDNHIIGIVEKKL